MTDHNTVQPITAGLPLPEFSRTVNADKLSGDEAVYEIEASAHERRALASRLELQGIDSFSATVRLKRIRGQMIRVRGTLEAEVTQTCVVTTEPVPNHVEDEFEVIFAPPHLIPESAAEIEIDPDAEEPPEPLVGNSIDIGELAAQHLSLALDPYPRCSGIEFEDHIEDDEGKEDVPAERPNPFLALAKLKRPQ